jgi:hypothetical protein
MVRKIGDLLDCMGVRRFEVHTPCGQALAMTHYGFEQRPPR